MMKNKLKGFTLLEVLITASITLVLGIMLTNILFNQTGFFNKQQAVVSEGLSLNDAVDIINNNIKQGSAIANGYPEESPEYLTGSESLVIKLPSFNQAGVISGTYDYVVLNKDQKNNQILRLLVLPNSLSERGSSNQVLLNYLKSITFKYYDETNNEVSPSLANTVETNLTIEIKEGQVSSLRSTKILSTLRNH